MADGDIVARTTSKWGGMCRWCDIFIRKGQPVYKLASTGKTTKHGQGPGIWVCEKCAAPSIEREQIARRDKALTEAQATLDINTETRRADRPVRRGHWDG